MRKKILFSIITLIICIGCLLPACFVTSCDRKKMAKFYNDDSNYEIIVGKIIYSDLLSSNGRIIWIEPEDNSDDYIYSLRIVPETEQFLNERGITLQEGDELFSITTSTKIWWNGWFFPVVAINRVADDEEILDFYTGKINFLNWIQNDLK